MGSAHILLAEDDLAIADVVCRYLRRDGFDVTHVADGDAAVREATLHPPQLLILDLMLPGVDGLEVCRRVRATSNVPIVMLTARETESDRLTGFAVGADDYVAKPFSVKELVARVHAVLRRADPEDTGSALPARLAFDDVVIDSIARQVHRGDELVPLPAREFDLLAWFAAHPHQAFSREELLEAVWGYSIGDTATVTVHVRRLREKFEENSGEPRILGTVWGVGYRFDADVVMS